jgi:transcription-repair coupling factor (superfamily II helicase)
MTTDVLSALARANVSFDAAARRVGERTRSDLTGLPGASTSLLLSRAQRAAGVPFVVVVEGMEEARHVAHDLELFANAPSLKSEGRSEAEDADDEALDRARDVLVLPASDVSPFSEVPSDRRTAMERLAVLSALERHLREGDKAGRDKSGLRFLVVPAAALLRKVPEPASIRARSLVVRAETELDREDLVRALENGGYLRVPAVEDAGTFAVRGSIVDVFSPHTSSPVRIELDDWLVLSLKRFDPEDQRTLGPLSELTIHPVRETAIGSDRLPQAKEAVRDRCEAIDLPTRATRSLLDDLEAGRPVPGMDALLPAFVGELVALPRYLPENMRWVVLEPDKVAEAAEAELEMAHADHAARVARKGPTYPLEALYRDLPEVAQQLLSSAPAVFHRVAVQGAGEDPGPLAPLSHVPLDTALSLAGEPHDLLVGTLGAERAGRGKDDALRPLAEAAQSWLDAGVRVIFSSRTRTQAERLGSLLKGYDVPLSGKPEAFGDKLLAPNPGRPGVSLVVADVSAGFALATLGVVWMTEEEIFGARARRTRRQRSEKSSKTKAFIDDLRALSVGDFVVHSDHGIGRYLGLEHRKIGANETDLLVLEYAGGDGSSCRSRGSTRSRSGPGRGRVPRLDRLGDDLRKAKAQGRARGAADGRRAPAPVRRAQGAPREGVQAAGCSYKEFEATFPFEETDDQRGPSTRCSRTSVAEHPDGPPRLRRRGLRQDRGGDPRGVPRGLRGRAGRRALPHHGARAAALPHLRRPLPRLPLEVAVLSRFVTARAARDVSSASRRARSTWSSAPTACSPRTSTSKTSGCSWWTRSSASASPTRSGSSSCARSSTCSP